MANINHLRNYSNEVLSIEGTFHVSDPARTTRIALKALTPGVAFFGRFPFAAICYKLGGKNYKGLSLAAGNIASYTALISWALYNMVDDTLSPKSASKKSLLHSSCCGTTVKVAASSTVGVAAQLPFAYLAYQYNDKALIMPVLILATDTIIPTYSSYLSMKQFSNLRSYVSFPKDLQKSRQTMKELLAEAKEAVLKLDETSDAYTAKINEIAQSSESDKLQLLLTYLQASHTPKRRPVSNCFKSTSFRVYQVALLALLVGDMTAIGVIGYKGWKTLDHNESPDHAYISGATVSVLANVYLFGMCIEETGKEIFKLLTGNYQKTLADSTLPKTSLITKSIGILAAGFSWGPSVQVSKDYFEGDFAYWQAATMSGATVLLVLTAILEMLDAALQHLIQFTDNQRAKAAVKAVDMLDSIAAIVDHIKPSDLQAYLAASSLKLNEESEPLI